MASGIYKRKPFSEKHKLAISLSMMGHKISLETRRKIGLANSIALKGRIIPEEVKRKMSKNSAKFWLGKKLIHMLKDKNPKWIKDRSLIKKQEERNNPNDKQWKYAVYKRDNFKCRIENKDCGGRIEAHHILSWRNYPELRYEINNGVTLCHAHHPKKRAEEKQLIPYFMGLVETKV